MRKFIALSIAFIILALACSGCLKSSYSPSPEEIKAKAIAECLKVCKRQLRLGENFSSGPCLSDWVVEGWACDVVHSPPQPVDNEIENQCAFFRMGKAKHLVEVDEQCRFVGIK